MTDSPKVPPFSAEAFSEFISKNGISTVMLVVVSYVCWTSFLKPASERHIALLDSVAETNRSLSATVDDLRLGLREVGEKNVKILEKADGNIEEIIQKVDTLTQLSRDIDRKLADLRPRSYMPPAPQPLAPQPSAEE